ncbi:hypothetical protein ACRTEV_15410 [Rossellomorea arthrocnemi]
MKEIHISPPKASKLEYHANIQVKDYNSIITWDCLLDEERVEITFPEESELLREMSQEQLENIKADLWRRSRLQEVIKELNRNNRKPTNSEFNVLLEKDSNC